MNKAQLVDKIASGADMSKAAAGRVLDSMLEVISESLKEGDSISIIGFGTFQTRERAARSGRNPQTGQEIEIPAARVPAFKAGKLLKDSVNE
ncbi:HU family DNA-binding protein [Celerinatantimonas sp. MCCC 1A17872]|uniref:HU family DNA-binding protein n=1 Tax=Celerinatantimonas sp. MCCC 1A17872 TaxID=3177514 RepID=UPI0038C0A09E